MVLPRILPTQSPLASDCERPPQPQRGGCGAKREVLVSEANEGRGERALPEDSRLQGASRLGRYEGCGRSAVPSVVGNSAVPFAVAAGASTKRIQERLL